MKIGKSHLRLLVDGIPIPLWCFTRGNRCSLFPRETDCGYCAAKDQTYYGFRGHLVLSGMGVVTGFTLTPAPLRSNMKDEREPSFVRLPSRFRRLIEPVIGQMCERFNMETVWARDLWHLTSRLNRKIIGSYGLFLA